MTYLFGIKTPPEVLSGAGEGLSKRHGLPIADEIKRGAFGSVLEL
jgi:hypothetical protein